MNDTKAFYKSLCAFGAERADPVAGFFGPHSITWQIWRERVLYLGGMRALLMQIAVPEVAAGVVQHSSYEAEPLARGRRTFQATDAIVFGSRDEAIEAATRVHAIHSRAQGRMRDGGYYAANDPRLLRWVYATLVDTTIVAYDTLLPARSQAEWERFYQEGKVFARVFGLRGSDVPETLEAFRRWMDDVLASDFVTVTPDAIAIKDALLTGSPSTRVMAPFNYVLGAGMLPPSLREAFGLRWEWPVQSTYQAIVRIVRAIVPRLSPRLRYVSAAQQGERRCRRSGGIVHGRLAQLA